MIEEKVPLTFMTVKNDQEFSSATHLINYKSIVSKALPNMDKTHIIRLLFDSKHQSLLAYQNDELVGGACYASFPDQNFVELAFFAIKSDKRIQGYGRKLMNKLKSDLQQKKMEYIITYGDNMALGFFRKQGFSQKITAPLQNYEGYIKEYDGGTLVEFKINQNLDYMKIDDIIKKQKEFVFETIKARSLNQTKFSGSKLEELAKKQKFQRKNLSGKIETFRINPIEIPGVVQSGWSWEQYDQLKTAKKETLQDRCRKLLEDINRHPESKFFSTPVSAREVPIYYKVILHPIDLSTINKRVKLNRYQSEEQICADLQLMFKNCAQFNEPGTVYYINGARLQELIQPDIEAFKKFGMSVDPKQ